MLIQYSDNPKIMQTLKKYFILFISVLFVLSCESDPVSERAKMAADSDESKGDIVIGIVASSDLPGLFFEGVRMAIQELNQERGVQGRKLSPIFYDDEGLPAKALEISEKLAKNPDVVAVVGHLHGKTAIPASITYERNGIIFISPGAMDPALTQYGGIFTFRNISSSEKSGRELAKFAYHKEYHKILVLYDRDSPGRRLAEIFAKSADDLGLEIVAVKSYFDWQDDIPLLLSDVVKKYDFDAVFLGGKLPSAGDIVRQLRAMGVTSPILGGDSLDSPQLSVIAGKAADGTIVSTVFDPRRSSGRTQKFIRNFKAEFGVSADASSALAYDAIRVLAHAIEKSGSSVPINVSTVLRSLENWHGIPGHYSFDTNGDVIGQSIHFKEMQGGDFEFLEAHLKKEEDRFDLIESVTLRLPVKDIPAIDPGLALDRNAVEVVGQLFLGLTNLDPKTYEAVPELAEKWTVDEDGRIYQFQLRKDVVWTDGSPVTAHDVVWAIRRNISPETKSPRADLLYILKNAEAIHTGKIKEILQTETLAPEDIAQVIAETEETIDAVKEPTAEKTMKTFQTEDALELLGVHATDDFTVEFTLEHPVAYFPVMAGLPVYYPLPQKLVKKYGEKWTDPEYIQTNGPYVLVVWDKNRRMILRRNPSYFDAEKISVREVRYHIIQKSSVGLAMYEDNELDIMGGAYLPLPSAELPRVKTEPMLSREYSDTPKLCTYAYAFDTGHPPVDNLLVRKAISAAIDRELLVRTALKGYGRPATTFTPPPAFGSVAPREGMGINFDPDQAKKWLAEAGYPDGEKFPEITFMYEISEARSEIAQAFQTFLKHYLNISVKLDGKEKTDYEKFIAQGNMSHIFQYEQCGDYPDADNWLYKLFHPYFSPNRSGWKNVIFAQLTDRAREITDPGERKKLYKRAEKILIEEEAVVVPIYFETSPCLVKPRVKEWYDMAMGGQHIHNWRLAE